MIITFLISGFALAQTNIIAAKSHAASPSNNSTDKDNFGLPYKETRLIQSVEYIKDDCLAITYKILHDSLEMPVEVITYCDHPVFQDGNYNVNRIKVMFPKGTIFIGFDQLDKKQKKMIRKLRRERQSKNSNLLVLFVFTCGLFLTYLFVPKLSVNAS